MSSIGEVLRPQSSVFNQGLGVEQRLREGGREGGREGTGRQYYIIVLGVFSVT